MLFKKRTILWWALLVCGALASITLLASRFSAESRDKSVGFAVFSSDVTLLARESGLSEAEWMEALTSAGVNYVVSAQVPGDITDGGAEPENYGRLRGERAFLLPDGDDVPDSAAVPVALVEDIERTGVVIGEGFDISAYGGELVKALCLFDSYRDRWSADTGGKEIENLIFRACVERGSRLVILRPFTDAAGALRTDPADYTGVLSALKSRFERYGITIGEFSPMPVTLQSPVLFALAALLTGALWVLLFVQLPALKRFENALCVLALAGLLAAHLVLPELCRRAMPLLCASVFPCLAAAALRSPAVRCSLLRPAPAYIALLAALLAWGLLGGLAVGALMSHRVYLMGGAVFTGVKLSQALPLGLCFLIFLPDVLRSLRADHSPKRLALLCAAAAAAAAAACFVLLRSGDIQGGVGALETSVRNFLENTLYTRPRSKELLFAVPASALFVFARKREMPVLTLLAALCAALECVSLINTFCHATAPLAVSLARGALGALLGAPPGLALLAALHLVTRRKRERDDSL